MIERRQKYYTGKKNNPIKTDQKIDIKFDLVSLNLMCQYIVTESRFVRRSHLINMRNLFGMLDMSVYENDTESLKRISFIKKGIEARLVANIKNTDMVIKYINGGMMDSSIIDIDSFQPMSSSEIEFVNKSVSQSIQYSFIYNDIDRLLDVLTRFKTADYSSKGAIVKEIETIVSEMQTKFRRSRVESESEAIFSLRNGTFEECIKEYHAQWTNPSSQLVCGMQGMNEMTGGGFMSARVYMLFGLPGEGKSLSLLNLAYQIKKHNKDFKTKDPTKIPCVVILTMENMVRETVERLFNIATMSDKIINYSPEEVIELLRTEGELYMTDDNPIDIIIKYVPNLSEDTGYLYTLTEDLEDEGYEVICMIQDYIKRIRSVDHTGDLRIDLGSIVNEFKTFSIIKDIPVISASQLNRDATKHIDEGRRANKVDLIRLLGRSNIGESQLMLENIDAGFLIAPEFDENGNKFMGIQRIKIRYDAGDRDHIYQPFAPGNGLKYIEDINLQVPVFRNSMRPDNETYNDTLKTQSNYQTNTIKEFNKDIKFRTNSDDDEFSFFSSGRVISSSGAAQKIITPAVFKNRQAS